MQDLKWSSGGLLRTSDASSQPGPSESAPVASLAPGVAAPEGQPQYGAHPLPQQRPPYQAQQQPNQGLQTRVKCPHRSIQLCLSLGKTPDRLSARPMHTAQNTALQHGQHPRSYKDFTKGALPSAASLGAGPSQEGLDGAAPNRASSALRAGGCTGVTVSTQAKVHEPEARQGQGHGQVKVQGLCSPALRKILMQLLKRAAQACTADHIMLSRHSMPSRLPRGLWSSCQKGQYVCVMQDGAKLTLEQLYYTLEHVGNSLPEDKYEALSMMIKQLTEYEKGSMSLQVCCQSVVPNKHCVSWGALWGDANC